jgi:galactokinase
MTPGFSSLRARIDATLDGPATLYARAPGRINIIGEHTDYIGGLALPAAIDHAIMVALRPSPIAHTLRIHSLDTPGHSTRDNRSVLRPDTPCADWEKYMWGAVAVFVEHVAGAEASPGAVLPPFDAVVAGDVPRGAGLSSSAALTVAWMNALAAWSGQPLDAPTIVALARAVEHRWLGVACGSLDQTASQCALADHLLRVDFRASEPVVTPVSMPSVAASWWVLDTGVRRSLAQSAYTERVHAVTRGLEAIQAHHPAVRDWRDLTLAHLHTLTDPIMAARLRHGISENARVDQMIDALQAGDLDRAGTLLSASHQSLRDDYAVSGPELDHLVDLLQAVPHVKGARMVGAGFGGCVLALADVSVTKAAMNNVLERYFEHTGRRGAAHRVRPGPGARVVFA